MGGMQPTAHENRMLGHRVPCRAENLLEGYVEQWVNPAVLRDSPMK